MPIGLFSPYSGICTRCPICCSFWGEVCIGMIYSWYCIGSALRLLLARMPIVFWSDGWWGVPLCFWFPRVLPTCYDRFHFIATYLCGICLLSICWNNSYGRTSICERLVGVVLSRIIPLRAGSFVLCIGLCGLSAPRRRFVGMRIDFYFWCVFSSSRLLCFFGGGVFPFCLADFLPFD